MKDWMKDLFLGKNMSLVDVLSTLLLLVFWASNTPVWFDVILTVIYFFVIVLGLRVKRVNN